MRISKTKLTKLLRRTSKKAINLNEFEQSLSIIDMSLINYLSKNQLKIIYEMFRKRTLQKYADDLSATF